MIIVKPSLIQCCSATFQTHLAPWNPWNPWNPNSPVTRRTEKHHGRDIIMRHQELFLLSKLIHFMIFCDSFVRVLWNRARHVDLPGHLVAAHARHGISWSGCAGGSACVHWHCYRRWKSLAVTGIQCGTSWNCSSQRKMTFDDLWNWQKWDEMRWFHTIKPLTHPQKLWEICKRLHYS